MLLSQHRILTTHAGSLPRSKAVTDLLARQLAGNDVDPAERDAIVLAGVKEVVRAQSDVGISVISDGEVGRAAFHLTATERMTGFGGRTERGPMTDMVRFPEFARLLASRTTSLLQREGADGHDVADLWPVPGCTGALHYDDELVDVRREVEQFDDALAAPGVAFEESFLTSPGPGVISTIAQRTPENTTYSSDEEYLDALAAEMHKEFAYVAGTSHLLQIDAPDFGVERSTMFHGRPTSEFLARMELHVAALNRALDGIPADRVRLHVCCGPYDGPHCNDPALSELLPLLRRIDVGAILLSFANPRHEHEYRQLAEQPLPEHMAILAGVVDVTTNFVEHPEVVADRIERVARAVGDPTRVLASTECGFGTIAGNVVVAPDVAWEKLRALVAGAEIASSRLFG